MEFLLYFADLLWIFGRSFVDIVICCGLRGSVVGLLWIFGGSFVDLGGSWWLLMDLLSFFCGSLADLG